MRRLHALWAVAGAAGLLAGAITPATSAPGSPVTTTASGSSVTPTSGSSVTTTLTGPGTAAPQTVTLITGDTVSLTTGPDGRYAVDVRHGKGREAATFLSSEKDGEISVLPADAIPLIRAGRLDPALFNVTRLVAQGYTDARTGTTPVIATYSKGGETPEGARRTLALPGIDGAALSARKSTAFWADIAPELGTEPTAKAARQLGDGIDKIWLDAKVKASLDVSVPQIGAPEVWRAGYDGTGVKVAVLDTGVDTGHPDLAGKIAESQSFVPDETVQDGFGHGTHVASTIVGSGAASDGRFKGVAPGAELLVGKVLNNAGDGQSSWIIAGMEWAAHSGAKIVSMSLGGTAYGPSDVLSETVDELSASTGTLFVIASGNAGPGEQTVGTPGIADSALTVGAVDKSDQLASFSSRGPRPGDSAVKPEITAPGVNITAARAAGTAMGTPLDDDYTTASGTSMATPHVAGAAALVAQAHPDWTGQQIKEALASTAKTNAENSVFEQGDGRVDAVRAVEQNVFATATLSFGRFEDGDTAVATKDITYTNTTDEPVELKISSSLPDITLGDDSLTVPARGTATVPVGVDPAQEEQGRYTGHVTATADGVRVTTGLGFEKAPKTYDLKVSLLGRDGKPSTAASIYTLMELNGAVPDEYGFIGSGWTWQVPAGTYSISSWIPDRDAGGLAVGTSVVGNPEIKVKGDTEVVLDARRAVEIKPRTKQESEFRGFSSNWHREGPGNAWGLTYSQGFWTDHLYVAPTPPVTEGTLEFSAKFRLYAPELTASVTSPEKTSLSSLYYSQTYNDFPLKISGDHRVQAVDAGGGTEADFAGLDVKGQVAVVPVRSARLEPVEVGGGGLDREDHVVLGDHEVVDQAGVRGLEPHLVQDPAVGVEDVVRDVPAGQALRLIPEGEHLTGRGVDAGMGGEGRAGDRPVEVPFPVGLQGVGVDPHGAGVLLQDQELPGMEDDVGVRRPAAGAGHGVVVGVGVAVGAEQRAAGGAFQLQLLGLHVAAAVVDVAVGEGEHAQHAVAVEGDVVAGAVGKGGVGSDLVVPAAQVAGDLPVGLDLEQVGLDARGGLPARVHQLVREPHTLAARGGRGRRCHGYPPQR